MVLINHYRTAMNHSYKKINEKYKKENSVWKKYLSYYADNFNDKDYFRLNNKCCDILRIFAGQLKRDEIDLADGNEISDCAIYVPRPKTSFDKKFNFVTELAIMMYGYDASGSEEQELITRKYAYIRCNQLVSRLTKAYREQVDKQFELQNPPKFCDVPSSFRRSMFCTLKNKPVSDAIKEPTAMPVSVSSHEELKDFFEYLRKNEYGSNEPFVKFNRGICYNDGRMDLCKQVVGPDHIGKLMDSLRNNTHVKHFLLGNNIIGLEGAKQIACFLKENKGFETWYLAGNDIDEAGAKLICEELANNTVCTSLWLKRNPIKNGIVHIAKMLETNKSIKILDLHNTGIMDDGVKYLFQSLKYNTTLRNLYLDANGLTEKSTVYISDYFSYLVSNGAKGITGLWIDMNRLDDAGITELTSSLRNYPYIKRLNIGSNRITSIGMKSVYENLKNHPSLFYLDLGCYKSTYHMGELPNNIQDEGADYIAQLITDNTRIKFLDISFNGISEEALGKILEAVQWNDHLLFFNYKQYNVQPPMEQKRDVKRKLKENLKNTGMSEEEISKFHYQVRRFKHTDNIYKIDSLYRNK